MNLFYLWITAVCLVFIITPVVIKIANKFKLVDNPITRYHPAHTHTGTIPRAGGLAIYIGFILAIFIFLPLTPIIIGIILSATVLVIIGLIDDKKDVNPYIRILTNTIAVIISLIAGVSVPFITNPITGGIINLHVWSFPVFIGSTSIIIYPISLLITFAWIMWTMNIIGWSAGVDGQMPGFVSISAFTLGILSLRFSLEDQSLSWVTIFAFIVSGVYAGFLPWNFYPQKIMPGYGGKTLAGFFLAILGILSFAKLGTTLLVLGIPTIDAVYTLFRRAKKGKPLVAADREHLHHKLLDYGWGKRKIALFYWIVSAILGLIALSVNSKQKMFAFLVVFAIISGIILWLNYFTHYSKQPDPDNG